MGMSLTHDDVLLCIISIDYCLDGTISDYCPDSVNDYNLARKVCLYAIILINIFLIII